MSFRVTTKGRYGLRAICRLINHYGQGPLSLQEISNCESIPIRYLEQIMSRLRRAGVCTSIRGPGGGYELARAPATINLAEVLLVLEGSVAVVTCSDEDRKACCTLEHRCVTRDFWALLSQTIQTLLENVSLKDLVDTDWKMADIQSLFSGGGPVSGRLPSSDPS